MRRESIRDFCLVVHGELGMKTIFDMALKLCWSRNTILLRLQADMLN